MMWKVANQISKQAAGLNPLRDTAFQPTSHILLKGKMPQDHLPEHGYAAENTLFNVGSILSQRFRKCTIISKACDNRVGPCSNLN